MPWYTFKGAARAYLAELNAPHKVLEYCLFQPGLFLNYLANPHKTSTHVTAIETPFDFQNKRAIMAQGSEDACVTWTTVRDLANVVVKAVEYEGAWPVVGGIRGNRISMADLIKLGEKLRGSSIQPNPTQPLYPDH
jgi:nucleoside-diphosphate-sugar epimerase